MKSTAIIDVGSNSVRYAVLDESTTVAAKKINSTVLADGLFFSGELKHEAIERTVVAIEQFCREAKRDGADETAIFATEAVRAAKNGSEFTAEVLRRTGIAVDVLSGETEAEIGYAGAASYSHEIAAVFDIGGASCEIVCGKNNAITYKKSNPVGCVRLRDGAAFSREKAEKLISAALNAPLPPAEKLIGIGGTATALGGMLACPEKYDMNKVHGSTVTREFLESVATRFFEGADLLAEYPSLTPNRARVIGYGALVSLRVLNKFGFSQYTVSERDNIEGYYLLRCK
ncbi:hypothetical protein [Pumilibacter intestinalis]|uniref:Ppx/GppA phosphatase family protein n=1 Tax=Pumilibacter intestinalis TaxID=2941511 RepID=UPI00203EF095|nr:hypothetical protein [Pumilibacter intestinalis]